VPELQALLAAPDQGTVSFLLGYLDAEVVGFILFLKLVVKI
jgi:hypothetical protein